MSLPEKENIIPKMKNSIDWMVNYFTYNPFLERVLKTAESESEET